ncbi:MAG: PQQ-dependent sugar dehydrogenase [Candidatus Levybacteria bacterium]|nr:PQQ-dependent sugar dehydrogenase [Candidatus Levybacteria bacterium]
MDIVTVERELLGRMLVGMRSGKLPLPQAKKMAKIFVASLPAVSDSAAAQEALCGVLDNLADQYQEARAVYVKYAIPYKEEKRREKIDVVTAYMRKGDIEKALKVIKE